ncbi:MAG: hypothetical protein R3Y06_01775 [Faecalibacterium sp.]
MPNNTYDNWRAITESDFVTLFIKTWFAFVATMRVLHPLHETDTNIVGDGKYILKYKDDFDTKYKEYLNFDSVKDDFYRVYKNGFKMIADRYPSYIFVDYYGFSQRLSIEYPDIIEYENEDGVKQLSGFKLDIKRIKKERISCTLKCVDKVYREKLGVQATPIYCQVSYNEICVEIIEMIKNSEILPNEYNLIETFYDKLKTKLSSLLYQQIEEKRNILPKRGNAKFLLIFDRMQIFADKQLSVFANFCKNPDRLNDEKLLFQLPYSNFLYNYEDGKYPAYDQESDCFLWFLSFAYRLRNALFHEIIDPLNEEWQQIFKSAYLVLKEIVDGNITYLIRVNEEVFKCQK